MVTPLSPFDLRNDFRMASSIACARFCPTSSSLRWSWTHLQWCLEMFVPSFGDRCPSMQSWDVVDEDHATLAYV